MKTQFLKARLTKVMTDHISIYEEVNNHKATKNDAECLINGLAEYFRTDETAGMFIEVEREILSKY